MDTQIKQPYEVAPGDIDEFEWDWSGWLRAGETITARTVTGADGATVSGVGPSTAGVVATVTISDSAALGVQPSALCTVTTSAGRRKSRLIRFLVARL